MVVLIIYKASNKSVVPESMNYVALTALVTPRRYREDAPLLLKTAAM